MRNAEQTKTLGPPADNAQGGGKVVVFSAPSGSGKSTIINYLMQQGLNLHFSIRATSRPPRGSERDGVEYYFLTAEEFRRRIAAGDFLEYEEVYPGCYYGTLNSEVQRIWAKGNTVLFDVDVLGGLNIKKKFGAQALAIFIQPPSVDELRRRLVSRGTDSPEAIEQRVDKAEQELAYAPRFDAVVVNDNLEEAQRETVALVRDFLCR